MESFKTYARSNSLTLFCFLIQTFWCSVLSQTLDRQTLDIANTTLDITNPRHLCLCYQIKDSLGKLSSIFTYRNSMIFYCSLNVKYFGFNHCQSTRKIAWKRSKLWMIYIYIYVIHDSFDDMQLFKFRGTITYLAPNLLI